MICSRLGLHTKLLTFALLKSSTASKDLSTMVCHCEFYTSVKKLRKFIGVKKIGYQVFIKI